jgi:hypothetical protein
LAKTTPKAKKRASRDRPSAVPSGEVWEVISAHLDACCFLATPSDFFVPPERIPDKASNDELLTKNARAIAEWKAVDANLRRRAAKVWGEIITLGDQKAVELVHSAYLVALFIRQESSSDGHNRTAKRVASKWAENFRMLANQLAEARRIDTYRTSNPRHAMLRMIARVFGDSDPKSPIRDAPAQLAEAFECEADSDTRPRAHARMRHEATIQLVELATSGKLRWDTFSDLVNIMDLPPDGNEARLDLSAHALSSLYAKAKKAVDMRKQRKSVRSGIS